MSTSCDSAERAPSEPIVAPRAEVPSELLARAGRIIERTGRWRLASLSSRLGRRFSLADVVQSALLRVVQEFGKFQGRQQSHGDRFTVWVTGITHEVVKRLRRFHQGAKRRAVGREAKIAASPSGGGGAGPLDLVVAESLSPPDRLILEEMVLNLRRLRDELPDDDRMIVDARAAGKSFGQIAPELGISEVAARQRHTRALIKLRSKLLGDST
jgi:RNA polymerase sigma factor (sigma-70 family)